MNCARVNTLGLCDAPLCQKPVRLLGSVYTLAVGNTRTLLCSQKKPQKTKEGSDLHVFLGELNITLSCQLIQRQ